MFGRKKDKPETGERPPFNPRSRVSLYTMGGLYLGYLLYQLVSPYLWGGVEVPSVLVLIAGVAVLGGGMAVLFYLAWRMYRMPVPVEEEPEELPGEAGEAPLDDEEGEEAETEDE